MEQERGKDYTAVDLIAVAKRDNNKKRPYLLVNPLQGKHVPVSPSVSLSLFDTLANKVNKELNIDGGVLFIGFAETATAIGAAVACNFTKKNKVYVMQTTREADAAENFLYFSETHSHATEQRLAADGLQEVLEKVDTIIFVEDEVTTGNTICRLINTMKAAYRLDTKKWAVASLLNGMTTEREKEFGEKVGQLCYLVKSDNQRYADKLYLFAGNGKTHQFGELDGTHFSIQDNETIDVTTMSGGQNLRRVKSSEKYQEAARSFAKDVCHLAAPRLGESILVLGTEEFMYPALLAATEMEQQVGAAGSVCFHATTRSPILPSTESEYPLHERWQLRSLYDAERITYIYNLKAYDRVFIITDATIKTPAYWPGLHDLKTALKQSGNHCIHLICRQDEDKKKF